MEERSSSRASGTTYHSFNTDMFEPPSPPRPPVTYAARTLAQLELIQHEQQRQLQRQHEQAKEQQQQQQKSSPPTQVQRQDSGYESISPTRRSSNSNPRPTTVVVARKGSNASSTGGANASGRRTRPSLRRSAQNALGSYAGARNSNQSLHIVRTNTATQPTSFFQFPSPDPIQLPTPDSTPDVPLAPTPAPTPPPQTTHYWTSDRTRRLEYAAIDAATRGVKGWVMRHLIPDCFIPRKNRHVSFDDDSGSVRRYRLDLEEDTNSHFEKLAAPPPTNEGGRRRKGWRFWRRRTTGGLCAAE